MAHPSDTESIRSSWAKPSDVYTVRDDLDWHCPANERKTIKQNIGNVVSHCHQSADDGPIKFPWVVRLQRLDRVQPDDAGLAGRQRVPSCPDRMIPAPFQPDDVRPGD